MSGSRTALCGNLFSRIPSKMRPSRRLWFRHWSSLMTVAEGLLKTGQDMKDVLHYFIGTPSEHVRSHPLHSSPNFGVGSIGEWDLAKL